MSEENAMLTKIELAARLSKHIKTIERWMRQGIIPYYQATPGADVMFDYNEVKQALYKSASDLPLKPISPVRRHRRKVTA